MTYTAAEHCASPPPGFDVIGDDILVLTSGDKRDAGPHTGASTTTLTGPSQRTTRGHSVSDPPVRMKRRNKPTLNCRECVERKSKCDRARPSCFTCIRRQTACRYTQVANIIASSQHPPRKRRKVVHALDLSTQATSITTTVGSSSSTNAYPASQFRPAAVMAEENQDLTSGDNIGPGSTNHDLDQILNMTPLFTNAIETFGPMVIPSPPSCAQNERYALLNLFGAATLVHPFQNYWTDMGGLVEVVTSLPSRPDADLLIERYFNAVDPVYPVLHRNTFVEDVARFRELPDDGKSRHDPAQIALQFAVYANAMHDTSLQENNEVQLNTAAFYLSCCHQSLCISNYLNRCSLLTIQTLILICHFMIASNRIADAWTISGIVQRQMYGLKLNRSPEELGLDMDAETVQARMRLWQAAMLQDTQLSLRLRRPPSTTYFNVSHLEVQPFHDASQDTAHDVAYVRAMWQCSTLIQETICTPQANHKPLATDAVDKTHLIARYQDLHAHFEEPFCQTATNRFDELPARVLYQMVAVATTYFHALTLVYVDSCPATSVRSDPFGAIRAAHEGMTAFFALLRFSPAYIRVWAAAHSRAYAMAIVIGSMLVLHKSSCGATRRTITEKPELMLGKSDFDRYISMLGRADGSTEFRVCQRERLANLRTLQAALQEE